MLFNSYLFILLFLPLSVCGYFALNHIKQYRMASAFLLLMSLWFYGYFNPSYLFLIIISIVVNYFLYLLLCREASLLARRCLLALGLVFDLGLIFYYKYYDFFIENVNALFSLDFTLNRLILPLGISFFTFQQVSFLVDSYRREVPKYRFLDYALFVSYFPQLIAGPIVTHDELVPKFADLEKRKFNYDNAASGLYLFVLGLAKKVLIADIFGSAVNIGFSDVTSLSSSDALVVMLSYTVQIYFDFSGYCDMASGIARMMNIELPENFRSPYKADSIVEFWRRWHITLTRFFTKYVYHSLGGNKVGKCRTYVNIMIVFLASGIWHGAAWTFVLWGVLHGVLNVITRCFDKYIKRLPRVISLVSTFACVNLLWVIFRASSVNGALLFFKRLLSFDFRSVKTAILEAFELRELTLPLTLLLRFNISTELPYLCLISFFVVALTLFFATGTAQEHARRFKPNFLMLAVTCLLLVWCIYSLSGVSTFLYFNF